MDSLFYGWRSIKWSKNKGNLRGKEKKIEIISEKYLQKYIKLFNDMDFPHKPDLIGICLLDFDQNKKAKFINLDDFDFSVETKQLLKNDFSLNNFLDKFIHLVNLKSYISRPTRLRSALVKSLKKCVIPL